MDDDLERIDIENAILKGRLEKRLTRDVHGTRYALKVQRWMADWCMSFDRFREGSNPIVITVYAL